MLSSPSNRAPLTPWDQAAATSPAPVEVLAASAAEPVTRGSLSSFWTIPALCIGIAVIACCILVPAADENQRLAFEREKLKGDLQQLQRQAAVNDAFLQKLHEDPTLAERLAQRQMKMVRQGTGVLHLKSDRAGGDLISPYLLVTVPPPAETLPYHPPGGLIADLVRPAKNQLYLIGTGLLMVAIGLVFGGDAEKPRSRETASAPMAAGLDCP